jgi:hypothetical protein
VRAYSSKRDWEKIESEIKSELEKEKPEGEVAYSYSYIYSYQMCNGMLIYRPSSIALFRRPSKLCFEISTPKPMRILGERWTNHSRLPEVSFGIVHPSTIIIILSPHPCCVIGTVLSTNWGEVGKKNYEEEKQAPKGMEWRSWEGDKVAQIDSDSSWESITIRPLFLDSWRS